MRNQAVEKLDKLREAGVSDTQVLEYIVYNWMTGDDANQSMDDSLEEFGLEEEEEEEE